MKPSWSRATRWGLVAAGAFLVSSCESCDRNPATAATNVSWTMSAIQATFDQNCYCTTYAVTITPKPALLTQFTVTWRLALTLVDPAGAADPDPENPGSTAQVDAMCDNNGLGTGAPATDFPTAGGNESGMVTFIWYHPNSATAIPPNIPAGRYHCDHTMQGPSGHQGMITVTVDPLPFQSASQSRVNVVGPKECSSTYGGTRSGPGTTPSCKS